MSEEGENSSSSGDNHTDDQKTKVNKECNAFCVRNNYKVALTFPRLAEEYCFQVVNSVILIQKTGWTSSESESSSDEENPLTIMSESDAEVDEALDEKRGTAPLKLTVRNVRSLLKVSRVSTENL